MITAQIFLFYLSKLCLLIACFLLYVCLSVYYKKVRNGLLVIGKYIALAAGCGILIGEPEYLVLGKLFIAYYIGNNGTKT